MSSLQQRNAFALQQYVTSCVHGVGSSSGLQVKQRSRDIPQHIQQLLTALGTYVPPEGQEDETALAPAFRCAYVDENTLLLTRSFYVERDCTGIRRGNYFIHGLWFRDLPEGMLPVQFFNWKGWKKHYDRSEDVPLDSYELPEARLEVDTEGYGPQMLGEFLNADPQRPDMMRALIEAALLRAETSRTILIREENSTAALHWIACLVQSFPPRCRHLVDFSSYQKSYSNCKAINVTVPGTDFKFTDVERRFQFFAFEPADRRYSEVNSSYAEYAQAVTGWLQNDPDKLILFHNFCMGFSYNALGNGLLYLLHMFRHSCIDADAVSDDTFSQWVAFISQFCLPEKRVDMLSMLASAASLSDNLSPSTLASFTQALLQDRDSSIDQPVALLLKLFSRALYGDAYTPKEFFSTLSACISLRPPVATSVYSALLDNKNFVLPKEELGRLNDAGWALYRSMLQNGISLLYPESCPYEHPHFNRFLELFIASCIQNPQRIKILLTDKTINDKYFIVFIVMICNVASSFYNDSKIAPSDVTQIIRAIHTQFCLIFFSLPSQEQLALLRKLVFQDIDTGVVQSVWRRALETAPNKLHLYQQYLKSVFTNDDERFNKQKGLFLSDLFSVCNPKEKQQLAIDWICGNMPVYLEKKIKCEVLQIANDAIDFDPDNKQTIFLAQRVDAFSHSVSMLPWPDGPAIMRAMCDLRDTKDGINTNALKALQSMLGASASMGYPELLLKCLPPVLAHCTRVGDHTAAVDELFRPFDSEIFVAAFERFLDLHETQELKHAKLLGLCSWLSRQSNVDVAFPMANFIQQVRPHILGLYVDYLKDFDAKSLAVVEQFLANGHHSKEFFVTTNELSSFFEAVHGRQGVLASIKRKMRSMRSKFSTRASRKK